MSYIWIVLPLLTFISRAWPRLVVPDARGEDTYYHLLQAQQIRENRFRLHERTTRLVIPGRYSYPPLYHFFLAIFTPAGRVQFEKISSAIFDALLVMIFSQAAIYVLEPRGWDTFSLSLLIGAFAFTPGLIAGMATGPRAYQGTPRTLGELVAAAAFVCLWQYWLGNGGPWGFGAVICASLMLLTSKFSAQMLVFFLLLMSFFLDSALLLVFPIIAGVVSIIMSGGRYYRIFTDQLAHFRLYAAKLVHSHPMTMGRKKLWQFPKTPRDLYAFFMYKNPYGVLVSQFFVLFPAIVVAIWGAQIQTPSDAFMQAWLLAAIVVFVVVSTPQFLFVGSAERYLEYALIPAYLLLAIALPQGIQTPVLVGIVALHLVLYVLHTFVFVTRFVSLRSTAIDELIDALNSEPKGCVLSILGSAPWELAVRTKHDICFSESLSIPPDEYEKYFWRYPSPPTDLSFLINKHGVTLIPASKKEVEDAARNGHHYSFEQFEKVFENRKYLLYRISL